MNKKLIIAGMGAAALLVSCAQAPNTLSKKEIAEGWELLFNGENLDGWRDYNGTGLTGPWEVVDGAIQADGKGDDANGYIVTDKEYENFELVWDWKISKGGNSGMIYHVVERPDFSVPYVTGPEYQLIDDVNYAEVNDGYILEPWQRCAVDYAMYVPDFDAIDVKPAGEWNTSRIIFDNGHVEYYVNGTKSVEFEAWTPDWFARKNSGKWENAPEYGMSHIGHICLQDHGYPAWFRNIKIRQLPRKPVEKDLFNGKDISGWIVYGTDPWYVENGELVCESGKDNTYGYFATEEYYDDFDLSLEFKQEANGNSGVFIRSTVTEPYYVHGWQVEVAPKGNDTAGVYESYGRGWLYQIPDEKEDILKEGEWNTMRILVQGDRIQTWLNGEPMTDLTDAKFGQGKGRIALQIHDGGGIKVRWRNIHIKTL